MIYLMPSKKRIYKAMDKADIICFDVFDTLIYRNVDGDRPEAVFEMVAYDYFGHNARAEEFIDRRIEIESEIHKQTAKVGEVTIASIYNVLKKLYPADADNLQDMELSTQLKVTKRDEDAYELYSYALSTKKPIYLVSDMYYCAEIMEEIVNRCGIRGYSKIYVSCDEQATKASGRLWAKIVREHPVKHIIHIGDGKRGDFLNPIRNKVGAFLYKRGRCVIYVSR